MPAKNNRETGARKAKPEAADRDRSHAGAAKNKPPKEAKGLAWGDVDETRDQNHPSEGMRKSKPTPSPETRKFAGAGPAIAEHSKDAKAPKAGRQPGACVKD
jgi:hypothetical protein